MNRTFKDYFLLTVKGIAMGAADVIPGVSGGTIAFISGIYEELINAIKSINAANLKLLLGLKMAAFWKAINGNFLLAVAGGILISIFSLAKLMQYLLVNYHVQVWAFFFGLILASIWYVTKQVKKFHWSQLIGFVAGAIAAYLITALSPTNTPNSLWFIFLCGAIAICAMILPGISGSFILLLLGKYFVMIDALSQLDLLIIAVFAAGAIIGLIGFSNVLSWLLRKFHDATVMVLGGFMLGSLNKVWPWKETLETFVGRHGEVLPLVEKNVLPHTFEQLTGNAHLPTAIVLFVIGMAIVFVIEFIANQIGKTTNK